MEKKLYYYIADSLKENEQELVSKQFKKLGARNASWVIFDTANTVYYLIEGSNKLYTNSDDEVFKNYIINNGINIVDLLKKDESKPTFKPFDKVLIRDSDNEIWRCQLYSYWDKNSVYPHRTILGGYKQCIPYEGNECLAGTNITI